MMLRIAMLLSLCSSFIAVSASPLIVGSIPPVCQLLKAIVAPELSVHCLIPDFASPHDYRLTPQDNHWLARAQVVFWVGPELESALTQWHPSAHQHSHPLSQTNLPVRLPLRSEHHHGSETLHHSHEDPHIWLSFSNLYFLIHEITEYCAQYIPEHAPLFQQRAKALQESLKKIEEHAQNRAASLTEMPFFVYHDAYQYLEHDLNLKGAQILRIHPEQPWTIAEKQRLHQLITDLHAPVFLEPQFQQQALSDTLPEQALAILDPLGNSQTSFLTWIQELCDALLSSLEHQSQPRPQSHG